MSTRNARGSRNVRQVLGRRKKRPEVAELLDRGKLTWKVACSQLSVDVARVDNAKQAAKFNPDRYKGDLALAINLSSRNRKAGLQAFRDSIDKLKALHITSLSDVSDAREVLPQALAEDIQLLAFSFIGNAKDAVLDSLVKSIETNASLEMLLLVDGTLVGKHAKKLIHGLSNNSVLHSIKLANIKLPEESGIFIGDYLRENKTVEVLILRSNKLGTEGAINIIEALPENKTLKYLDLSKNNILGGIAFPLHDIIIGGCNVRVLSLADNAIDYEGATRIIDALRIRKVLAAREFFKESPDKFKEMTQIDFMREKHIDREYTKIFEELSQKTIAEVELKNNSVEAEELDSLYFVLDAPLLTIFRYSQKGKEELYWSQEAWYLSESEVGPKYILEAAKFLFETLEDEVKKVLKATNHDGENMVEALLKNKFNNIDIFEAIKFFCVKCDINPEDKDSLGRPFIEVMRHHENKEIRKWANEMGALDGKYKFKTLPPLHVSSTAEILVVDRVEDDEEVVLKIYRDKENLQREIQMREMMSARTEDEFSRRNTDENPFIVPMLDHSAEDSKYFYAVYQKAEKSLFDIMNTERVAGIDLPKIKRIMKKAAHCLHFMNSNGIMHGDFKPKSLLRLSYESKDYRLIDFDSSAPHGEELVGTMAPAYIPPEAAYAKLVLEKKADSAEIELTEETAEKMKVVADEKFDVWSFGVVLFEMLSGLSLFESLKASDQLASTAAKADLINWLEIPSSQLERILEIPESKLKTKDVFFARELVRWCLQRSPEMRPTFHDILAHPFFTNAAKSKVDLSKNFRTHMFLSHIQKQAAGTVKDLYYCSAQLGCSAWLDMKAGQITQQAMYDGVQNTEAFIVCVTNGIFYSNFCLKEFMWALDFERKMIFLLEVDPRELMFPFNRAEFTEKFISDDNLNWLSGALGDFDSMMMTGYVRRQVEANDKVILEKYEGNTVKFVLKELVYKRILSMLDSDDCIPYRRREYENVAMMNYLLERIGFVPPSDPVLDDREELANEKIENIIQEDEKKQAFTADEEDGSPGSSAARGRPVKSARNRASRKMQVGLSKQEKQRRKMLLKRKQAEQLLQGSKEDVAEIMGDTAFTGTIFVLIGQGIAAEMANSFRENIHQYLHIPDMATQWVEFGHEEEISYEVMDKAMEKGKFVILSFVTQNYFTTKHGPNLLGFEEVMRKRKMTTDLPVVMIQEDFFAREWGLIVGEMGTKYNHYLLDVEFMPYREKNVREYEYYAMLGEVTNRINAHCDVYSL